MMNAIMHVNACDMNMNCLLLLPTKIANVTPTPVPKVEAAILIRTDKCTGFWINPGYAVGPALCGPFPLCFNATVLWVL